jgi:hypothetical protein
METKLTKAARDELAQTVRKRYRAATGKDRKRMLSEFIAVSGYHPKYAIEILNREESGVEAPQKRNRPRLYDEASRQTLIVLWEASDRVCGKRLKPLLRILLPALERHGHLSLDEAIRTKVLAMSAASIDRFLRGPNPTSATGALEKCKALIHRSDDAKVGTTRAVDRPGIGSSAGVGVAGSG